MKLLLLLLVSVVAYAQQDGEFPQTKYLSFTPSAASWASLTSWRLEFRISDIAGNASEQGIFGNNTNMFCVIPAGVYTLRCRSYEGTSSFADVSLAGRSDVRVRFQRLPASGTVVTEVWNGDGSNYATASVGYVPSTYNGQLTNYIGAFFAGNPLLGKIGFVRMYSSVVPLGSAPPTDLVTTPADLVDVELEGNTTDSSVVGSTITTTGDAITYDPTVLYPPVASFTTTTTRAGQIASLNGTGSSDLTSDSPLNYFWTCTSAPSECEFTDRTSQTGLLSTLLAGEYGIRLTVSNALNLSNTTDGTLGVVATDVSDNVILDAPTDLVVGPVTRDTTSPWSWFDLTGKQVGNAIAATIPASPGDTALVGTIALTPGSTSVVGTGTSFLTTFACNGTDNIMIHYPVTGGTGRRVQTVMSCASDTALTIDRNYDATVGAVSGVAYGLTDNVELSGWINGSNNWNYYDQVVAFYKLYYRTGLESYRTQARDLADKWYKYPFDGGRAWINEQGYWQQAPRLVGLMGLMLRANDGKPEYWPGIVATANLQYTQWNSNWFPSAASQIIGDVREQGYASLWQTSIAALHPDEAVRTTALSNANAAFNSYWKIAQTSLGGWMFPINPVLYYSGDGTLPWQSAWTGTYLTSLHRLTNNSEVLDTLQLLGDFMTNYGIDPLNDGGYYDAFYTRCPAYDKESQGTVAVTNGSTAVTGSGTNFLTRYACNGTDRIALDMTDGTRLAYVVQSCGSNTSLTLASSHTGVTQSGVRHLKFPTTGTIDGCGVCPWGTCGSYGSSPASAVSDARTLLNAIPSFFGYLFAQGRGTGYKTTGDAIFAQNLGKDGPGNDGNYGHFDDVLRGGSPPSYLANTFKAKESAFVLGASGVQAYLAWRNGIPAPVQTVNLSIQAKIDSVVGATKIRVTATNPNGSPSTTICTSSPCLVAVDKRQGNSVGLKIEYLNTSDMVLASGSTVRALVP